MTTLSWNCRGLRNPQTLQVLKDLSFTKQSMFIFLTETMICRNKVERAKSLLGYEGLFCVDIIGHGGGIAMLWKKQDTLRLLSYSQNHIDFSVHLPNMPIWRLTDFYGCPERCKRQYSWNLLKSLKAKSNLPWCVIGDFNDLLHPSEKKGQHEQPNWLSEGFHQTIKDCDLCDIGMEGYTFTWEQRRGHSDWVEERLDRITTKISLNSGGKFRR